MAKFRCGVGGIPVLTDRFYGVKYIKRLCVLHSLGKPGDEYHYLFEYRQKYLPVYFRLRPNAYEMELISIKDIIVQSKLPNFVKKLYLYLDMGDLLIDVLIFNDDDDDVY